MPILSRRQFLLSGLSVASLGVLSGCGLEGPTWAWRARRPPRVGFLALAAQPFHEPLFQGLRDLGYVEGQTIIFERRYADGHTERLSELAAELVRLPVDVLVAVAGGAEPAQHATTTIPIVVLQNDAVEQGFVASLARPGGNLTGMTLPYTSLTSKRLEITKAAFPAISRLALLESGPFTDIQSRAADAGAATLGLTLTHYDVHAVDDFAATFEAIRREQLDGLFVLDGPLLSINRDRIFAFAAQTRMPSVYPQRIWADDGGVIAYGANFADLFRRMADYVDKILKGAKPGEIPMEAPTVFDFVVNLRTAQTQGLTISSFILQQATEIIQ